MRRTRASRQRRRRETPRPAVMLLAGLATIAVIVGFIWMAEESYNGLPFFSYRTVYAALPNIGHLQQHDPVDIAGVRVGQVLRTETRHNRALIELQLQGVGPIPVNSKAIVRADGLLGERYVELDLGNSSHTLANGGTITEGSGTYTWGLPETLNLFNTPTRRALGEMIDGLGTGLLGRGSQLNGAIHVGPASGDHFDTVAAAILSRPGAAAALLPASGAGFAALDRSREALVDSFHPAAVALTPLISARSTTDRALSDVPSTLQAISANLGAPATALLGAVRQVARAADTVLPVAPAALNSATALLRQSPRPLSVARHALNVIPRAVPSTLGILRSLKPDLAPLTQGFTKLVGPVTSLAEHGCDIQNFATNTRSLTNFGTNPGAGFGPDVGFPITATINQNEAGNVVGGGSYPTEDDYPAPCAYSPGPTLSESDLTGILGGVLP